MRIASLSLVLLAAFAAGCTASAEDDASVEASESAYSAGPDGLARWLGTNHAVRYMGQFLDWRAGATTPFIAGPLTPELASPSFPLAVFESREVEAMMKIAREADRVGLPVLTSAPSGDGDAPDLACVPAGVHVYSARPTWLAAIPQAATGPEERARIDAAHAGATTEVLIALPGDDLQTPMVRLAFGIVSRPQSAQPGAATGSYWTILGASVGEPRCTTRTRTVFSLSSQSDNLLTINDGERQALVTGGRWYAQTKEGRGDFELAVADGPGHVGIHRCFYPSTGLHFFSQSATCEGGTNEGLLGYAASAPRRGATRSLRRCFQTYRQYTHVLGGACQAGGRDDGILGWVP